MNALFQSKKFKVAAIAAGLEILNLAAHVAAGAVCIGEMNPETAGVLEQFTTAIRGLQVCCGAYVTSQGVADIGKEKAKVEKGVAA